MKPKQITFTQGDVVALLIALDIAREAPFREVKIAKGNREGGEPVTGACIVQLATWTELTAKLEKVFAS